MKSSVGLLIKSISIALILVLFNVKCIGANVVPATTTSNNDANQQRSSDAVDANSMVKKTRDTADMAMCPSMLRHIFDSAAPRDEKDAGTYKIYSSKTDGKEIDMRACVMACCEKQQNNTCNVVLIYRDACYHVSCISNEACFPKPRSQKERLQYILVNPVRSENQATDDNRTWLDILKGAKDYENSLLDLLTNAEGQPSVVDELSAENANGLHFWRQPHKLLYPTHAEDGSNYDEIDFPTPEKRMKYLLNQVNKAGDVIEPDDLAFYGSSAMPNTKIIACDIEGISGPGCPPKEECAPLSSNSPTGICKCMRGYVRNPLRQCVPSKPESGDYGNSDEDSAMSARKMMLISADSDQQGQSDELKKEDTTIPSIIDSDKKLVVSVISKEVQLPEKEVTLAAFAVPDEQSSNTKYSYLWSLIKQPNGPMNGTISDQSKSKVKLSNLSEGLYTFKVTVTGENGTYGEAMANVTVLPEKRINKPPQVIISPKEQIIRQPTTNAILDGSASTDDNKIVSWHWEVVSGPIGYQPKLPDVNTLQLTDLTAPGNYTFKLTITDSDNATNSTTAQITLLQPIDYPPVANAGDAVILYLPNNNVTLNGSASTDDHEIVAWEWTKDASDETKAVDMQNTRTPYVQLSNLEEGMYTFVLKVTDGSGQSSTAKVHVFVKPPTNSPPTAIAGQNTTISLPQNWITLNGSHSTDDIRIRSYKWKQIFGPNSAVILDANATVANATSLTLGLYQFELRVTDEHNNSATDFVWVKVVQEKNSAPIANAGGDLSVTLPLNALYLNGTKSWDDLGIVKYEWTRDDASLAAGVIVGNTDKEPVLILTNLVHGRYVFKLTVSDDQGLTSSDTVSVIVHPDPLLMHLVQLTLPMSASTFSQAELTTLIQKIGLLLGDMKIRMRELKYDVRSQASILVFYVEKTAADGTTAPVDGLTTEQLLKTKLQRDASILGTEWILDVRTTVCQNKCSDHGVCNSETRACICEAFWMPSAGYFWGVNEANCDWSILYVFVGVIVTLLLLSAFFWSIACACRKQAKVKPMRSNGSRPKVQKYSLIGAQDEEAPHFGRTNSSLTDSETDSDVLFETRSKSNGILRSNGAGGNKLKTSHGQKKLGRKIRT